MSGQRRTYGRRMPPLVRQSGATCWAAALSSWLPTVPGRDSFSVEELLNYFAAYTVDGQMLDSRYFRNVAGDIKIRMDFEIIGGAGFTHEYADELLHWSNGYVITKSGTSISHARVVFGLTETGVGVVDPMLGIREWGFEQIKTINALIIGWAKGRAVGEMCKPDSGLGEYYM